MLKDFTKRPDLIWFMFNWLLCNSRLGEDHRKSRDTSKEATLVALEGASPVMVGDDLKKSGYYQDVFLRQKSWAMLTD